MMNFKIIIWAVLPLMMISACTTTRTSRDSSLQQEVDALKQEVAELRDQNRLEEMRTPVATQTQNISPNYGQDNTGYSGGTYIGVANPGAPAYSDAADTYDAADPAALPQGSTAVLPQGPEDYYEMGKSLFEQRKYSEAISRLRTYLSENPGSENASAAQFYIAESLYARQQYEDAILEYQKVIKDYPKSSQVAYSLLKQGQSFQAAGDNDSARLLYTKVIRDFPKSPAYSVANARLKALK